MRSIVRPILLLGLLVLAAPLRAAEAPVVVVLPFEVTSPQRLDYLRETLVHLLAGRIAERSGATDLDRKSTRLNSSHITISYAVFCLKKKTTDINTN